MALPNLLYIDFLARFDFSWLGTQTILAEVQHNSKPAGVTMTTSFTSAQFSENSALSLITRLSFSKFLAKTCRKGEKTQEKNMTHPL